LFALTAHTEGEGATTWLVDLKQAHAVVKAQRLGVELTE
jgi:hypothetical protein